MSSIVSRITLGAVDTYFKFKLKYFSTDSLLAGTNRGLVTRRTPKIKLLVIYGPLMQSVTEIDVRLDTWSKRRGYYNI